MSSSDEVSPRMQLVIVLKKLVVEIASKANSTARENTTTTLYQMSTRAAAVDGMLQISSNQSSNGGLQEMIIGGIMDPGCKIS